MGVFEQLQKEWPVITQAPLSFISVTLLAFGSAWLASKKLHEHENKGLKQEAAAEKARAQLSQDRCVELQRIIDAAPDKVASDLVSANTEKLNAFRNLADIAARWVEFAMNEALEGRWPDPNGPANYETCLSAIRRVPFADVEPHSLIELFAEVENMTLTAQRLIDARSGDLALIRSTSERASRAIRMIDEHLQARG